jgi:hypothetical protein
MNATQMKLDAFRRAAFALALCAIPALAQSGPALRVTVGTCSVTATTTSATYSPAGCGSSAPALTFDGTQYYWDGSLGDFSISIVGQSRASLPSPALDVGTNFALASGPVGGTVTIAWSDNNFTGQGPIMISSSTTLAQGAASAVYTAYGDSTNALFGTEVSVGPGNTGALGTVAVPVMLTGANTWNPAGTYSLTGSETFVLAPNSSLTNDFALRAKAEPSGTCVTFLGTPTQNIALVPVQMTASGGAGGPYTFTATGLPAGVTMASDGTISGTPTVNGVFNYTVTIRDSAGTTVQVICTIAIATSSVVTPPTNQCGLTWGYWKNHLSAWPVSSLVLGSQTYSMSELICILNSSVSGDASLNLAHQLIAAKLNVLNGTNAATAGTSITDADNVLKLYSGKLPYHVSSSSTNGSKMTTIASKLNDFNSDGLLQPGCTNGGGGSTPPPLTLKCPASTDPDGGSYSSAFIADGGTAPYSFKISSGMLNPGLTLNTSTGTITGTPTASGTYTFTGVVTDSNKQTATASCSINLSCTPPPSVGTVTCPISTAVAGSAYSSAVGITGATGPFTFTMASKPSWMVLNSSTGAVSGTPAAGTYMFIAYVTSTAGMAQKSCTIVVTAPPPATNTCSLSWGYWKTHTSKWPVTSLKLGGNTYTQAQLMNLLGLAVNGDASIDLAHQLIGAKLNIAAGTPNSVVVNGKSISSIITSADNLITGQLPMKVSSNSSLGKMMTSVAGDLDDFNADGQLQSGCTPCP